MKYADLIKFYGSAAKAADAGDVTRQAVHRWKRAEIPLKQQVIYEVDTHGALKADLPNSVREGAAA